MKIGINSQSKSYVKGYQTRKTRHFCGNKDDVVNQDEFDPRRDPNAMILA